MAVTDLTLLLFQDEAIQFFCQGRITRLDIQITHKAHIFISEPGTDRLANQSVFSVN